MANFNRSGFSFRAVIETKRFEPIKFKRKISYDVHVVVETLRKTVQLLIYVEPVEPFVPTIFPVPNERLYGTSNLC